MWGVHRDGGQQLRESGRRCGFKSQRTYPKHFLLLSLLLFGYSDSVDSRSVQWLPLYPLQRVFKMLISSFRALYFLQPSTYPQTLMSPSHFTTIKLNHPHSSLQLQDFSLSLPWLLLNPVAKPKPRKVTSIYLRPCPFIFCSVLICFYTCLILLILNFNICSLTGAEQWWV